MKDAKEDFNGADNKVGQQPSDHQRDNHRCDHLLITRYNYQKYIPTDKLEFAYNRIYYPIFQLLPEKNRIN